ncbi:hypothetical protein [uncultured Paludibaculum sp.]|uniref:hypothetical protein n=1 Tax=uncultured Paludibaculum sp. TaxID=1765020 RepID=UPI002AABD21A|nr:hypothetical protein [uncultured Paludibaculum sp.]
MRPFAILCVSSLLSLAAAAAAPTFNHDVAPILFRQCATCHRPGEVAPFSLLSYQDAAKRAQLIAAVTENRVMPPWKAEPGQPAFANERRLTPREIDTIRAWAKAGAPEGAPQEKPKPPVFASGWQAGQPNEVLTVGQPVEVAPDGPDQYRCFVLPRHAESDVYVRGVEFRPGNARVVHHALVFLDSSGTARKLAANSKDGSYACFGGPGFPPSGMIAGWAPGATPALDPAEWAQPIPKSSDIVVQIHYHPSGKREQDRSSLGLTFSGPPTKGRAAITLFNRRIDIQPGDAHYVVRASVAVPRDVDLYGITPHAHYLGKDMKVDAHLPDGTTKHLIWIKDWDFNWQGQYRYQELVHLPKGTRIELEYVYDNSESNPHNPSQPPVRVTWGEETKNEMALAFLGVVLPSPADVPGFQRAMRLQYLDSLLSSGFGLADLPSNVQGIDQQRLRRVFQMFDRNGDGRLDDDERESLLQLLRSRGR